MSPSIFSHDRRDPIKKLNRNSKIEWNTRVIGLVIFIILMIAFFARWSEASTKHAEAAYQEYESCVQDTYGVTAAKFYQVYGREANCK
jgi:uncharacterized protein YpmB